jgi:hypothetical protein
MYKIILLFYTVCSLFVFAETSINITQKDSIQNLVKQVKIAKPSEKRLLMNRLKIMLRKSNQAHRTKVMKELKKSFSTHHVMHQGKQRREHKYQQSHSGKHQAKHRQHRYGKTEGSKDRGRQGGGNSHR